MPIYLAIYGHIPLELLMSTCVLICLGVYADLLFHNWSKLCQKCRFRRNIESGTSILYQEIFYYYLWSYVIEINMSACGLPSLQVYGDLQREKLVKDMPKMPILSSPGSRISNMIPQHCAKTSSITIYGHMAIKTDMPTCVLTSFRVY